MNNKNQSWYLKWRLAFQRKKYQEQSMKLYLESTKNYNLNVGVVGVSYTLVNQEEFLVFLGIKT